MNTNTRIQLLERQIKNIKRQINEVLADPYPFGVRSLQTSPSELKGDLYADFKSEAGDYVYHMELKAVAMPGDEIAVVGNIVFTDKEGEVSITGRGDAFRIMSTVVEITERIVKSQPLIKKFVNAVVPDAEYTPPYTVDVLTFSAWEEGRQRLYDRIIKTIPGYSLYEKKGGEYVLISDRIPEDKRVKVKRMVIPTFMDKLLKRR